MSAQRNFFVTGFPRSRTSWLAAFLTTGQSFCHHDGLRGCQDIGQFARKMVMKDRDFVGDSDSGLVLFAADVTKLFPEAPWVVVVRPRKESLASFAQAFPGFKHLTELAQAYEHIEKELRVLGAGALVVTFEDLNNVETAEKVWSHCLPGVPFDKARWKLFDGLRIQPHAEKYDLGEAQKEAVSLAGSLAALKGAI